MKYRKLSADALQSRPLPSLDDCHDKDSRGRVLVIAGGREVPGAALLAGLASMRAGAGKLQFAAAGTWAQALAFAAPEARVVCVGPRESDEITAAAVPSLLPLCSQADGVVIGPGMLNAADASSLAAGLSGAQTAASFVLDAGALTELKPFAKTLRAAGGRIVLTPHSGEMASLLERPKADVERDPAGAAAAAAAAFGAVVALKGPATYIASPEQTGWVHEGGVVGLGTSGSGDVLAGLIGGLLARGASPGDAALWGVYVHAEAGRRLTKAFGAVGFLARELLPEIPPVLERHRKAPSPGRSSRLGKPGT